MKLNDFLVIFINGVLLYMIQKIKEANFVMILPKDNVELEKFIIKNKISLTEQTLDSIEFAIEHDLPVAEVFKFKDSDFLINIFRKDFSINIDHIYNLYLETENYELCSRVVDLKAVVDNITNSNEKEIETNGVLK